MKISTRIAKQKRRLGKILLSNTIELFYRFHDTRRYNKTINHRPQDVKQKEANSRMSELSRRKKRGRRRITPGLLWRQRYLLMMSVPLLVWLVIFKYIPLWGWTMAFQEVKPATFAVSMFERKWVGFDNFLKAFHDRLFAQTMWNTLGVSFLGIVMGTLVSVGFAVLLNELKFTRFKKLTQTISYLPHFVSWVIIASIAKNFLGDGGVLDSILDTRLKLMSTDSVLIWFVIVFIDIWKETGWNAIIYLSAMAGIDNGLYEAASIDGAGRFRRIWHVTLPGIKPTIIILLIMSIGSVLSVGMERQMLLSNGVVQQHTMVLSWFSYKRGIGNNNYGLGTAIGMFQSLVGLVLLLLANRAAKLLGEDSLL